MIRAWRYREGVADGEEVAVDGIALPEAPRTLLWVDADEPEQDVEPVVAALAIHHLAAEDLGKAGQRTKLEPYGDHWQVAIHDLALGDGELLDGEFDLVFGEGWLLTVRHRRDGQPPSPVDDVRERFERQRHEHGSTDEGFLLWAILDTVVDRYFDLIDEVDARIDEHEELVFAERDESVSPQAMYELHQVAVSFRRRAAGLREVTAALLRREVPYVSEPAIVHLQDVNDHVLRALERADVQRELLTGLRETQLALASMRMNEVMKATSSWGAILIVGTLVAGIYGMNFRHMPELDWYLGYPFALGVMGAATAVLIWLFRKRGWL